MAILTLVPVTKKIIWGGEKLSKDFGIGAPGESVAEAWQLACRPDGDNVISGGEYDGKLFSEYIREHPESVGTACKLDRFPLLIKLIDAKADLSIQVHPDDAYAAEHTDDYGKTEMWYIVDAEPGAKLVYGMKEKYSRDQIKSAIAEGTLEALMNYVPVHKGEVYFIPSGLVHAIGAGILIAEIQQNSNITYRVYDYNRRQPDGSLRQLHVEQALDVIERTDPGSVKSCGNGDVIASCRYFTVRALNVRGSAKLAVGDESFAHLMCLEGEGSVCGGGAAVKIKKGGSVFVAAGTGDVTINAENAKIIVSSI